MDLSKLTPAPWKCYLGAGGGADGFRTSKSVKKERNAETDAEFIALARNAFDIMMRHPSWTLRACLDGEYRAYWHIEDDLENRLGCGGYDPFTALAEADKWYKENMENNQ